MSYKTEDCLVVDVFTENGDLEVEGGFVIDFIQHFYATGSVSVSETYAIILDNDNKKISEHKLRFIDVRSGFMGEFE